MRKKSTAMKPFPRPLTPRRRRYRCNFRKTPEIISES